MDRPQDALKANPFTYGNPISDPERFIGRRREVDQVFSRLCNPEHESSSLVGERRIGKTSLLNYLAHPDVRLKFGLDPDRFVVVYVDLQMVDKTATPTRLWQRLLRQIARNCQAEPVKQILEEVRQEEVIDNFALEDVFDSVDAQNQYVVLLLDEFENVTENPNFGPDFFYGLRSLAIHHHLSLITSSRRELIELCHSDAIRSSPFFNIFANINVGLFGEADARQFIARSLEGSGVSFSDADVSALFRLAGYHPYFLQAACYFLFEASARNLPPDERASFLASEFREEAIPHMADYWHNSDDHQRLALLLLALLGRQSKADRAVFGMSQLQDYYARSDQMLSRLEKRGLVVSHPDGYALLNSAMGEWIVNEIIGVESQAAGTDSSPADPIPAYITKLRQNLESYFNDEDLRNLCADLGVEYEDLPAEGKAGKARELVNYMKRRECLPDLVQMCRTHRPKVVWEDGPESAAAAPGGRSADAPAEALSRVDTRYQELIMGWVAGSKNPTAVSHLLQSGLNVSEEKDHA